MDFRPVSLDAGGDRRVLVLQPPRHRLGIWLLRFAQRLVRGEPSPLQGSPTARIGNDPLVSCRINTGTAGGPQRKRHTQRLRRLVTNRLLQGPFLHPTQAPLRPLPVPDCPTGTPCSDGV